MRPHAITPVGKEDVYHLIDIFYRIDGAEQYDRQSVNFLAKIIGPSNAGGPKVLEIGCGLGSTLIGLHKQGYRCIGLDKDFRCLSVLGARARAAEIKVICSNWVGLRTLFQKESFDALICWGNSLIYTQSWGRATVDPRLATIQVDDTLEGAYRCLRRRGKIIIESIRWDEKNHSSIYHESFNIDGKHQELLWHVEHDLDGRIRTLVADRHEHDSRTGKTSHFEALFVGLLLGPDELLGKLRSIGFADFQVLERPESPYVTIVGEKR
jgi:SAM-dependent methyltransferase